MINNVATPKSFKIWAVKQVVFNTTLLRLLRICKSQITAWVEIRNLYPITTFCYFRL